MKTIVLAATSLALIILMASMMTREIAASTSPVPVRRVAAGSSYEPLSGRQRVKWFVVGTGLAAGTQLMLMLVLAQPRRRGKHDIARRRIEL